MPIYKFYCHQEIIRINCLQFFFGFLIYQSSKHIFKLRDNHNGVVRKIAADFRRVKKFPLPIINYNSREYFCILLNIYLQFVVGNNFIQEIF